MFSQPQASASRSCAPAPQRKTVSHNLLQSKSEKARRYSRTTVRPATAHVCAIRSGRSICGTFRATPTSFVDSVTNGKRNMPPWDDVLDPDDIEALWAYVIGGEPGD